MTADATATVRQHTEALMAALMEAGMVVAARGGGVVRIKNPLVHADPPDPVGEALNPGLVQSVALNLCDGVPWWYWLWSGPTRNDPLEPEPMCPAHDLPQAVAKICRVLAVPAE